MLTGDLNALSVARILDGIRKMIDKYDLSRPLAARSLEIRQKCHRPKRRRSFLGIHTASQKLMVIG